MFGTTGTAQALQARLDAIVTDSDTFGSMTKDRRGGGSHLKRLRARVLHMVQGGACTLCGEPCGESDAEWAHLIPQSFFGAHGATGGKRGGYVDGNMTVWHKACNDAHGETVTTADMLALPGMVWLGAWRDIPNLSR